MNQEFFTHERKFINSEHMGNNVQVGEYIIHYYEQGEGEPLVLIHTVGQSLYTWHRVIDTLSQYYRVIALDLIGFGYSDKPTGIDYSINSMAEIIARFMNQVNVDCANICAFSMSSFYALRLAQIYPEMVNKLILISPGGITPTMPSYITSLESPLTSWFAKLTLNRKQIENLLNDCFFDLTRIDDDMIDEYTAPLKTKNAANSLVETLRAFDEEETLQQMRAIEHETLLIWGLDDKWHELEIAELFRISIRNIALHIVRNCGHVVHEEKEDKFVDAVRAFIEGMETNSDLER